MPNESPSWEVIKRPRIACSGWCDRELRDEIVVLEYKPTSTLLFFCHSCASNRLVLDDVAEKLGNIDTDLVRDIDIGDSEVPNVDRKEAQKIRARIPSRAYSPYDNHQEIRELSLISEGYRHGYLDGLRYMHND